MIIRCVVLVLLLCLFLFGCSDDNRSGTGTISKPVIALPDAVPSNLGSSGSIYSYVPTALSTEPLTVVQYATIDSTQNAVCAVWFTGAVNGDGSLLYERHCVDNPAISFLPPGCTYDGDTDQMSDCANLFSSYEAMAVLFGPARDLSAEEQALCQKIADQIICTAARVDGSAPPAECVFA